MNKLLIALLAFIFLAGCSDAPSRYNAQARGDEAQGRVLESQAWANAQIQTAAIDADARRSMATLDFALATQAQAMQREAGDRFLIVILILAVLVLASLVVFFVLSRDRANTTQILIVKGDDPRLLPSSPKAIPQWQDTTEETKFLATLYDD